jgi:MoaD family protein
VIVALRLFAAAREAAGRGSDELDVPAGTTLGELLEQTTGRYGDEFAAVLRTARVWVNTEEPEAGPATVLTAGDEVAVLPPVSGG